MASRLNLQTTLEAILGSRNVYFDPPASVKLSYPCIIYERAKGFTIDANNAPYIYTQQYEIMLIDKNPDSQFVKKLATSLPTIRHDRHYTADNLHHDVFSLYY